MEHAEPATRENEQEIRAAFRWIASAGCLLLFGAVLSFGRAGGMVTEGLERACAEAAFGSGQDFEKLGNHEQALAYYQEALHGNFPNPQRRHMCGRAVGEILYRLGRYAEASAAYRALPPEAFSEPGHYAGYVGALVANGQDEEGEAAAGVWLGVARDRDDTEQMQWAHNTLGTIYQNRGDLDRALAAFWAAADLDPAAHANISVGHVLRSQRYFDQALDHLDRILAEPGLRMLHRDAEILISHIRAQLDGWQG
jgi:tetratricopeptide (TPR) repeat protein